MEELCQKFKSIYISDLFWWCCSGDEGLFAFDKAMFENVKAY